MGILIAYKTDSEDHYSYYNIICIIKIKSQMFWENIIKLLLASSVDINALNKWIIFYHAMLLFFSFFLHFFFVFLNMARSAAGKSWRRQPSQFWGPGARLLSIKWLSDWNKHKCLRLYISQWGERKIVTLTTISPNCSSI